ncbi:MAG: HEAT repeat domain-containing protein [Alphaproteobacteria bacterium]|nr:HEAT repeat domain-containing protein [Alphaproteobacteria bacterium]
MAALSPRLEAELRTFCSHTVEDVVSRDSDQDFTELREVLSDPQAEPALRRTAVHLLGRFGRPEAVPDIVRSIPHLDATARITAIDALGHLGGDEALAAVVDLSHHADPDVRRFVVTALDRMGSEPALAQLKKLSEADDSPMVRRKAERLLQRRHP